jgi:hypothetical protein
MKGIDTSPEIDTKNLPQHVVGAHDVSVHEHGSAQHARALYGHAHTVWVCLA